MKSVVWGSGAIGGVVGAAMAMHGEDVLMVDIAPDHVNAMNEHGLCIKSATGGEVVRVNAALPEQVTGTFDFVFLAVKSQFTNDALDSVVPRLTPESVVISLQNGVNEPQIAERIGADRTIGCLVDFSADYHAPGEIMRARAGNLYIGELDGHISGRLEDIRRLLAFTTETRVCANIMGFVWAKICKGTLDAMTALVDTNALELRADQAFHPIRRALLREGIKVAAADGVQVAAFSHFDPAPFLDESPTGIAASDAVLDEMARGQAHNNTKVRTGYWRDIVVRRRKTEIEYVTGEIVHRGRRLGIPAPVNTLMLGMFEEIESGRRAMNWANLEELSRAVENAGAAVT